MAKGVYDWKGNREVGAGRGQIAELSPPSKVARNLDLIEPIEGHNVVEFTPEPQGDATKVTWAMYGPAPFFSKLMQVSINMDKMVGKDFETVLPI
jgi:hypothetical protein